MNRAKSATGWVKNQDGTLGYTWNPVTGCLNHVKGMCKGGNFPCYAYGIAHGRVKPVYLANNNIAEPDSRIDFDMGKGGMFTNPFYPRFWNSRLLDGRDELCSIKPKGIFVCDMSDLFGVGIPGEWTQKVMAVIKDRPQHRFYLLTKQPQNLIKFSPFPDNCWVGVSATNRNMAHNAFKYLRDIKAGVKYISFEPLLSWGEDPVSLEQSLYGSLTYAGISWVIIGAQTKPYKPPKIEWVKEIVKACDRAGIPVSLKDNLSDLIPINSPLRYGPAGELRLRQEMPRT